MYPLLSQILPFISICDMLSGAASTARILLVLAHPFTLLVALSLLLPRALLHSPCAAFSPSNPPCPLLVHCYLKPGIPLRLTRNIELKGIPHERQLDNRQHGKLPGLARANMTAR